MTTSAVTPTRARPGVVDFVLGEDDTTPHLVAIVAAGLMIAVAIIHIQDQGGILGDQSPMWLKWGYYLVELTALLAAVLIARKRTVGWLLGLGASIGPFAGYVLSRTVGIPGDSGDIGNWGYVLGAVSLIVEATFVVVAAACLYRIHAAWRQSVAGADPQRPHGSVPAAPSRPRTYSADEVAPRGEWVGPRAS